MSTEIQDQVDRLERAVKQVLGISLAEFDSPKQATARLKQVEEEEKLGEKAQAKAAKQLEGPADATTGVIKPASASKSKSSKSKASKAKASKAKKASTAKDGQVRDQIKKKTDELDAAAKAGREATFSGSYGVKGA